MFFFSNAMRGLPVLLQSMNNHKTRYREIFITITYFSWAKQHCIKWFRTEPGKWTVVFPFQHGFESLKTKALQSHSPFSIVTDRTPKERRWRWKRLAFRAITLIAWNSAPCRWSRKLLNFTFHSYWQNPKRTPLKTTKPALHIGVLIARNRARFRGSWPLLYSHRSFYVFTE